MSASALDKVQKETHAKFGHDRPFPLAACATSVLGQRRRAIHGRHWPPCPRDAGLPRTESQLASALEPASSDLPRTATMARWHVIVKSPALGAATSTIDAVERPCRTRPDPFGHVPSAATLARDWPRPDSRLCAREL
ncbi:hypothetical protein MAA_11551 [Metarhizium robertsii ARSEF 23]|uniref:Uncharacterized protein n=1 Tax=Metarhizium robertsii (strain ARSEF 23 / ATCC MYA-3075) TaxID=655844 RepID=A0A0B2XDN9_METRA|nr:uncharacterized protein MAA_11551 [Metarhizium robertsii ARSEF 23]KHO10870.1 hypothetical protein MAA_11551 [Metarhizium robertsii ARSEF 23]